MSPSLFEIGITRQGWIDPDESDMPVDLCSHGDIRLEIGGQLIVSGQEEEWYTISTSALALLTDARSGPLAGATSNRQALPSVLAGIRQETRAGRIQPASIA